MNAISLELSPGAQSAPGPRGEFSTQTARPLLLQTGRWAAAGPLRSLLITLTLSGQQSTFFTTSIDSWDTLNWLLNEQVRWWDAGGCHRFSLGAYAQALHQRLCGALGLGSLALLSLHHVFASSSRLCAPHHCAMCVEHHRTSLIST